MLIPGAYFRDETIWRGRMVELSGDFKSTIYELAMWATALYFATFTPWEIAPVVLASCFFLRMLFAYVMEWEGRKRVEQDIRQYFDETYSGG